MAHTIKIKRGMKSTMPSEAGAGEPLFTMDTKELFIGGGSGQPLASIGGTKVGVSGSQDYLNSNYFEQDSTNHIRILQSTLLTGVNVEQLGGHTASYFSPTTHNHSGVYEPVLTKGNLSESTSSVLTVTGGSGSIIGSGVTIQVKKASASQDGYLSSTDFGTFSNKQSALGYTPVPETRTVNGHSLSSDVSLDYVDVGAEPTLSKGNLTESTSSVLTISGGTDSIIGSGTSIRVKQASSSQAGYLSSTDWSTFNGKQAALGYTPVPETRTVNGHSLTSDIILDYTDVGAEPTLTKGNFSESTSSVLTITGGTNSIIGSGVSVQVKQASAAQAGYLSSTDWSTFNGKQDALGYTPEDSANKGVASGYASLDVSGKIAQNVDASKITTGIIDIARLPPSVIERLVIVADQTARFALTITTVQNGDTVKEQDTGLMFYVMDDTNLGNANGYAVYTAGTASAVEWSGVLHTPTSFSGYGITDVVASSDVVTTATANKILRLDSNAKLPADITGDANTLDGHDSTYFSPTTHDHSGVYEPVLTKGNLSESTSSVLTITGGTNSVIGSGTSVRVKQASGSQDGYLSSTDWNTFNGKQAALGYTPVPNTRTVNGQALNANVSLGASDVGAEPTLTKGNLSESTSAVLTITGGTNAVIGSGASIQVKQASATISGYLSSADWSTFNGKLDSSTYTANDILTKLKTVDGSGSGLDSDYLDGYTSSDLTLNLHGFVDPTQTTIALSGAQKDTLTLAPTGSTFQYYRLGTLNTITGSKTLTLPDLGGGTHASATHYIYIDNDSGTLVSSTAPWDLDVIVPVAIVAWNQSNASGARSLLADERHTTKYTPRLHKYLHLTRGTQKISGGAISGFTLTTATDAANTYSLASSVIADEDIFLTIPVLTDGNGTGANNTLFYHTGVSTWGWKSGQNFSFIPGANNRLQYDTPAGLVECTNNRYINSYVFATNFSGEASYATVWSQQEYTTLALAQAESMSNLDFTGFPISEFVPMYQINWRTNDTYGDTGKARIERVLSINISSAQVTGTVTSGDHNVLINRDVAGSHPATAITTDSLNRFVSDTQTASWDAKQAALTIGNLSESTSSVLTITGGTGAIIGSGLTIQVKAATTSVSGYLSSTDWNTFNGKQAALGYAPVNKTGDTMSGVLTSSVVTGTAPFAIASTTKVTNLNVDSVDGCGVNDSGSTTSDIWTASKIASYVSALKFRTF